MGYDHTCPIRVAFVWSFEVRRISFKTPGLASIIVEEEDNTFLGVSDHLPQSAMWLWVRSLATSSISKKHLILTKTKRPGWSSPQKELPTTLGLQKPTINGPGLHRLLHVTHQIHRVGRQAKLRDKGLAESKSVALKGIDRQPYPSQFQTKKMFFLLSKGAVLLSYLPLQKKKKTAQI